MSDAVAPPVDALVTRLLDGKLLLRQPRTGHRVGTDAVLLAAAAAPKPGDRVLDAGSGVGAVGLAIALRALATRVVLLDVVPELAALARENVTLNGLGDRVGVEEEDLFAPGPGGPGQAAWVVSNPPFNLANDGRASPDALRARAHRMAPGCGHGDWLRALLRRAAAHARVVLIHRPEALPALLAAAEGRLGQVHVMPVHAREGEPAIRILFGGVVGSRAGLTLAAPLLLHRPDGSFTPVTEAIHRGDARLALLP